MEVDPPPILPNLQHLRPANLKRGRSASAEENEKKRVFLGQAYDDILDSMFEHFGLSLVACATEGSIVYTFEYNGNNRLGEIDVIKLFFRLKIVDTPSGRKAASLSFYADDRFGTMTRIREQLQALGLAQTVTIECGMTLDDVKRAFRSNEGVLREVVVGWLNFVEAFYA